MEEENKINSNDISDLIDRVMSDDNSGETNIQNTESNNIYDDIENCLSFSCSRRALNDRYII